MRSNAPSFGPKDAKVTLVEFLDPECESCRAFYPFTKKLLQQFPNDLRLVIRYMPLHKNSKKAIRILEASRLQNKYKETMDIFFEKQPQWGDHHHPRPELLWTYLPEIGLDVEKVKRDILSPQIDHWIQKDIEDAKKLGVRRTPTFFINGQPLAEFGFQELEQAIINAVNSK
jgi:protein-disulfide isomerase